MKRGGILNRQLSNMVASLGHLDEIVVADAGLPTPVGATVVDLAVCPGIPGFWDVVQALRSELVIEAALLANEASIDMVEKTAEVVAGWGHDKGRSVTVESVPHETFKRRTLGAKVVIRTGEWTPYYNLILVSGVAF